MTLSVKIQGKRLTTFQNASVIADIGAVTRGFSLTSTAEADNLFPIKVKDIVEIDADGIPILKGYAEALTGSYSRNSHKIKVSGRSLLCDLVDSTVPTQTEYFESELEKICKEVMTGIGLTPTVINNAGKIDAFDDISSAKIGQRAFQFLESFSRKRQVLLTTDGFDGLVLDRAGRNRSPINLKHLINSNTNNILRSEFELNHRERYNKYSVKSELNPAFQNVNISPSDIADQGDTFFDPDIRSTRQFELEAEESMDEFTALDRAKWEANLRKAKSFSYTATVQGHSEKGQLWLPNTLVNIVDEMADVKGFLLIKGVSYNYSLREGSTTQLRMTYPNAYTLELEQTQREAIAQSEGDGFLG